MNMFARFYENPAMTLQDIKGTKRYGRTHGRMDGQRENNIPTTKFAGDINTPFIDSLTDQNTSIPWRSALLDR